MENTNKWVVYRDYNCAPAFHSPQEEWRAKQSFFPEEFRVNFVSQIQSAGFLGRRKYIGFEPHNYGRAQL